MKLLNASITFEFDNGVAEIDVLTARMGIEAAQEKHPDDVDKYFGAIRAMLWDKAGMKDLTDSLVWQIIRGVDRAYDEIKKKSDDILELDFGTQSIPSDKTT